MVQIYYRIFLLFLHTHTAAMVFFSAIQNWQPRMSQFPWVNIFFQGSWRLTNKINQCNDTNLLHATSHLWLRVAWSSQNGLEPFQPHFLRWHEPLLHQTSGAEATARADWPTWSLVYLSWGWVPVDWLIMITASSFLFRYHMQKKLRGCSPQSFNTKLSAHLRGRRIGPSGSRLNCVKKC